MAHTIVIVGGGVAGCLTANRLAKELGPDEARIIVVDDTGRHVFPPGFLYLALDKAEGRWLSRDLRRLLRDRVELIVDRATRLDPVAAELHLERSGVLPYDHLVVATGARLDRDQVPGLAEATHDFYSLTGAERLREAMRTFTGGHLVIGVAGMPYSCPPAPIEFALMADDYLRKRGVRDDTEITFLSPINRAFVIDAANDMVEDLLRDRGIAVETFVNIESVDTKAKTLHSLEGESFAFDLAVIVPPQTGSPVVVDSGLGDPGGWVPTDPYTLRVKGHTGLYAQGDATDISISKSGSTAHFESPVIVEQIVADIRQRTPDPQKARFGGRVICFFEVGRRKATVLRFDYETPPRPPKPSWRWHIGAWLFNRAYWATIPRGRTFGVR